MPAPEWWARQWWCVGCKPHWCAPQPADFLPQPSSGVFTRLPNRSLERDDIRAGLEATVAAQIRTAMVRDRFAILIRDRRDQLQSAPECSVAGFRGQFMRVVRRPRRRPCYTLTDRAERGVPPGWSNCRNNVRTQCPTAGGSRWMSDG